MAEFVFIKDVSQLAPYPLFSRLNEEQLRKFYSICREETFLPGATLHQQGEPADHVFIILQGQVAEELVVGGRVLSPLKPLSAGDVTGCSALFPPNVHTCTARAITEVNSLVVDASKMRKLFDEDCEIARSFYRHVIGALHHRMRSLELIGAQKPSEN
ncbi:MAG TPA: cyclic nucleotide-binding domain-containing protein [Anaerolineae bacterium]|nr:cyclic nucleotide-binding domain-containing protein [Caldilineae bacterium]HID33627.1 cyclic nucleotide-binding domain-containing protein [Anaerolineae bacterium]